MSTKIVWQTDRDGYYAGPTVADESPLEPGHYLIPAGAVEEAPPHTLSGEHEWRWVDGAWKAVAARPVTPAPNSSADMNEVRRQRDALLRACDWTQLPDVPLDAQARAAWATYRQALRDLPEQPGFPHAVEWPAQPTGDSEA